MSLVMGVVNLDHLVEGVLVSFLHCHYFVMVNGILWDDDSRLLKILFVLVLLPTNVSTHQ